MAKEYQTLSPGGPTMRDYQHASRLYVDDNFARAPKLGFTYFVRFNVNTTAFTELSKTDHKTAGMLVKKVDLPKFTIDTETINQYNRKKVIQKKITYNTIKIDLHDDNRDVTTSLWLDYFRHYYNDTSQNAAAFGDTKFGITDYRYGIYDNSAATKPFFDSIDIFVFHKHRYSSFSLVNPKIKEWGHDSLDQSEGGKILQNSMTVEYENVHYGEGMVDDLEKSGQWPDVYYDKALSPILLGNGSTDLKYKDRAASEFDKKSKDRTYGSSRTKASGALFQLASILLKNYINQNGLTRQKSVAYNIAGSAMSAATSTGAGKYASPPSTESAPGVFTLPGGVGINIFKGINTSVDGSIRANPAAILFPPK